jgi:hypothetical protein
MNAHSITNLAYESINEKYSRAKYGDFDVIMDMSNGYINATKLCANGGKQMKAWLRNNCNKELIKYFESESSDTNSCRQTYEVRNGTNSNNINGTYVHQHLIPHIAAWVSPIFAYNISIILHEWKLLSPENEFRYWNKMGTAFAKTKLTVTVEGKEAIIRDQTALEENGVTEFKTPVGLIDVLTHNKIIEIKIGYNWKHALGQVKCYGFYYPDKEKWIYLFECNDIDKDVIDKICIFENVNVKYIN